MVCNLFRFIPIIPFGFLIAPPGIGFRKNLVGILKIQRNVRRGIIEPRVGRGWSQTKAAAQKLDHFAVGMIADLPNAGDRSALRAL